MSYQDLEHSFPIERSWLLSPSLVSQPAVRREDVSLLPTSCMACPLFVAFTSIPLYAVSRISNRFWSPQSAIASGGDAAHCRLRVLKDRGPARTRGTLTLSRSRILFTTYHYVASGISTPPHHSRADTQAACATRIPVLASCGYRYPQSKQLWGPDSGGDHLSGLLVLWRRTIGIRTAALISNQARESTTKTEGLISLRVLRRIISI